jgi:hypothetical protein
VTLNELCDLAEKSHALVCSGFHDPHERVELRRQRSTSPLERWSATTPRLTGLGPTAEDAVRALLSLLRAALSERLAKIAEAQAETLAAIGEIDGAK